MKRRHYIIAAIILLIAIAVIFAWRQKPHSEETTLQNTNQRVEAEPALSPQRVHPEVTPATTSSTAGGNNSNRPLDGKAHKMAEALAKYNDVPVDFYGKLEDQFHQPVADADIKASIMVINGTQDKSFVLDSKSDAYGLFEFHGKGQSIGMMPKKDGYALASAQTEFNFSQLSETPFISEFNRPTILKMRKLQGPEPLVAINQRYKLPYVASPITFDLLNGKIVDSGGDITITLSRSPGVITGKKRLDWSVTVEIVQGGLIKTSMADARVTYEAPEDDYQSSDTFLMSTNAPNKWSGGFDQMYFVKSRNGQVYSKINFGIGINQKPDDKMEIEFRGIANANSSRNWEDDPNTMKTQ